MSKIDKKEKLLNCRKIHLFKSIKNEI
jgi:hypothetical protein